MSGWHLKNDGGHNIKTINFFPTIQCTISVKAYTVCVDLVKYSLQKEFTTQNRWQLPCITRNRGPQRNNVSSLTQLEHLYALPFVGGADIWCYMNTALLIILLHELWCKLRVISNDK